MSEWKFIKLQEVLDFGNGKVKPQNEGNIPIYGGNGILGYGDDFNYSGETIIIGRVGAYCGSVYYENRPIWISDNALSAKPKGDNNAKFLYYFLKNSDLNQWAGGSSHPLVTQTLLNSLEFSICVNPKVQVAIASVLSSLDDKIDLLHRQNATLEKMAETLFRQWFVERCPEPVEGEEKEEWEIKKLGAIAEIQNGFAFSSKDYVEYADTHLEVFKMGHIQKGGGLRTDPKRDYVPRSERLKRWFLNKGDIVMAMTDMKDNVVILGVPAMIDKDDNYVLNQRVARIYLKDKSNLISNYLLFIQLKDVDFIQELQSKANSGVQVNLSTESIKDSDIIIPPLAIQKEKSPIIDDLYTKVELNQTQIRTLTALRDTLLPKLMSGEVRVEE